MGTVFFILILLVVGMYIAGFILMNKEASLAQQAHDGYTIVNIPKTHEEIKKMINQTFTSLWWTDVPGMDGSIYKKLKIPIKYSGLGPEVGFAIEPSEEDKNNVNVSIILTHWNTHAYAPLLTTYIGVSKAVKKINKLRRLLGDPSLV